MAYLLNTQQYYSHDEPTVREDLADEISIIDPIETPLQSLLRHDTITQREPEWPVDSINKKMTIALIDTSVQPEGADAAFADAPSHRTRLSNVAQINRREIDVTGTMDVVDAAGTISEFAHQLERETLGLAAERDWALHWGLYSNAPGAQTSQVDARSMHGLIPWLAELGSVGGRVTPPVSRGLNNGATSAPVVPAKYFPHWYNASLSNAEVTLTPTILFDGILAPAYRKGMRTMGCLCLVGSELKSAINNLTYSGASANTREIPAEMSALYLNIDIIDTQHGKFFIALDRHLDVLGEQQTIIGANGDAGEETNLVIIVSKTIVFIDPEYFRIGVLRKPHYEPLAKTGDSRKGMILGEMTLKVLNPLAGTGGSNLKK